MSEPTNEESQAVVTVPETTTAVEKVGDNLDLVAATPTGLEQCQVSLIDWMKNKIEFVKTEIATAQQEETELQNAYEYAKKQKWRNDVLHKQWQSSIKRKEHQMRRLDYYHKLLTALENGYFIVPPMGMEIFAIRTDKGKPLRKWRCLTSMNLGNFEQDAQVLPEGKGDYQNPQPEVEVDYAHEFTDPQTKVTKRAYYAESWKEIDFPHNMVKPRIMEATTRAMAIKVFDELGVLPQDYRRNPDPVIIGKIYEPLPTQTENSRNWRKGKAITFMIAWHLNTKDL